MKNIYINDYKFNISFTTYKSLLDKYKNRIIKVLYLIENGTSYRDIIKFIDGIILDLYGCYIVFGDIKFINSVVELSAIKYTLHYDSNVRKNILDLANFVSNIKKEDGKFC